MATGGTGVDGTVKRTADRATRGASADLATRIVDAAEHRLAVDGDPAALSLRAIARDVGVTAPAIYTHFARKDDIVVAVLSRHFAELDHALDTATSGAADPHGRLAALCRAYGDFAAERPGRYRMLFGPDAVHYGVAFAGSPGAATFARFVSAVAAAEEWGADPRPDGSGAETHERATALWSALHGTVMLRANLTDFPWPPLDAQLARLIDGLVTSA